MTLRQSLAARALELAQQAEAIELSVKNPEAVEQGGGAAGPK